MKEFTVIKDLAFIEYLVVKLKPITGTNEKLAALKDFYAANPTLFKKIFEYLLSYKITFGITSKNVLARREVCGNKQVQQEGFSFFNLLDSLASRTYSGHKAADEVNAFIAANKEYEEIILGMIDRDLKIRVGAELIQKIDENILPTFEVALGKEYTNQNLDGYLLSRKMDGMRCIYKEGQFFSRNGHTIDTLSNLLDNIPDSMRDYVLDGEICVVDEKGDEDFQSIMKLARRKDYTIPLEQCGGPGTNLRYNVFDILTKEEFESGKSNVILSERLSRTFQGNKYLHLLEQTVIKGNEIPEIKNPNQEGWIARKNTTYKNGRSSDLLKIKKFEDDEFKVLEIEKGIKPMLIDGSWKDVETLAAVIVDLDGTHKVRVGSGFCDSDRIKFYNNPNDIVGHNIKVKFFERTVDQRGESSLRFPIYVCIRDEVI